MSCSCCSIKSVLKNCISMWYNRSSTVDKRAFRGLSIPPSLSIVISCSLPFLEDFFRPCCLSKAASTLKDPEHPGYHLFHQLPSGRHFKSIISWTNRLKNSLYHISHIRTEQSQMNTDTDCMGNVCLLAPQYLQPDLLH